MIARELVSPPPYVQEVAEGLLSLPKSLPAKLFYDPAGSALFEEITRLPEYYLTRTELQILRQYAGEIVSAAGARLSVIELGSGTASKTCTLLDAICCHQLGVRFYPVDISPAALTEACARVKQECEKVIVHPVVADFSNGFNFLRNVDGRKLVLYLGSSIGNFDPEGAVDLLQRVRRQLNPGDALLLGTDLVKDPAILIPAYDDAQGVTAEFNKNILRRLNRDLAADFNLDLFRHIALWNSAESRMEMHLESLRPQVVNLRSVSLRIRFMRNERIHTENSYKYTVPMVCRMLSSAGFALERSWYDERQWFALHLARV